MIKRFISFLLSVSMMFVSLFSSAGLPAEKLRILVPKDFELSVGEGRALDCIFKDREDTGEIIWSASPGHVAVVDAQGRVTAVGVGQATIKAVSGHLSDTVTLTVPEEPTKIQNQNTVKIQNFGGKAVSQIDNLQKIVTRYPKGSAQVPAFVTAVSDYTNHQRALTADGAVWEITDYGVLRTDEKALTPRDRQQRFMGDRYFYSADTTDGKVLAIFPDGGEGIWSVMANGFTHISMVNMSGRDKAVSMSAVTQEFVERHGMVASASYTNNEWRTRDDDNDGLWTAMYAAGELMRYAVLRDDPSASAAQIDQARQVATRSAEAILMLHYISMREGTTEAYIRRYHNGSFPGEQDDRWLSAQALEKDGKGAICIPSKNPAALFNSGYLKYSLTGSDKSLMNEGYYNALNPSVWSNPAKAENEGVEYAKQTRRLKGFVARTYFLEDGGHRVDGNIYWKVKDDKTAMGVSEKREGSSGYLLNNENLRGFVTDASGEIPERLWKSLIGSDYTVDDIIYKGDTSADEIVGHMFIFKLIYDILAPEDPELKELLVKAADNLAGHLADNGHMLVDGSGQPTTWSDFSRTSFSTSSAIALAPLHALVVLNVFKVAAYITGFQKWENEYRMLALDPAYRYAEVAAQYSERMHAAVAYTIGKEVSPYLAPVINLIGAGKIMEAFKRIVVNYSDEEMAMLAFYVLFQLECDDNLLSYYRWALDDWWVSMKYSENPLWYYIYQLAYPNKTVKDAYGNDILKTAAWSLSRHPVDTVRYLASNRKRDDIAALDFSSFVIDVNATLSYKPTKGLALPELTAEATAVDIVKFLFLASRLDWAVAAPDERALHKYNSSSFWLDSHHNPRFLEASTTYTLPYWLGLYHEMLK
ncbi:MAG: Ig-like domain-containing protein [Clostridiales bacterium]|nr:Ig-like domain-containing protein [Clostridiales bacterium]